MDHSTPPAAPTTGQAIRHARTAAGVSLRELARRIDVSPGTLSAIENGKTGVAVGRLQVIAAELRTTAADLLREHRAPAATGQPHPTLRATSTGWRRFDPLPMDPAMVGAVAAFVETGYHGATMRSIAERSGLSVPGVYHYHRSKQDLLLSILDLTMADLLWRTEAARDEGRSTIERIELVVEALALYHTHRRELAFIGASEMRSLEPVNRRRIAGLRNDIQHLLDAEIDAAVAEGRLATTHPREAGRAISTMCTALPQWFRIGGPSSPEQIATRYARFALDLLVPVAATPGV